MALGRDSPSRPSRWPLRARKGAGRGNRVLEPLCGGPSAVRHGAAAWRVGSRAAQHEALLARGAYEAAAGHYSLIVLLHAAWLIGLWLLAPSRAPDPLLAALYGVLQILRLWVLATLGERWTTRIIILPGAPLVREGPYRFIPHPNYTVVVAEIVLLPCVFGLLALPWRLRF